MEHRRRDQNDSQDSQESQKDRRDKQDSQDYMEIIERKETERSDSPELYQSTGMSQDFQDMTFVGSDEVPTRATRSTTKRGASRGGSTTTRGTSRGVSVSTRGNSSAKISVIALRDAVFSSF